MAEAPAKPAPPPFCGDIDIRIAADGTWFHEGRPIARPPLVALFARVLRREADGGYWLVTPVERARIAVDDSPFVAVEMERRGSGEGQRLRFRTNLDEWAEAGATHSLRLRPRPGGAGKAPYLALRDGLEARVARAAWYPLARLCVERAVEGRRVFGVWSGGVFFPFENVSEESSATR